MFPIHEGGCLCGAVRYRVKNDPVRATGSTFGIGAYFREPTWSSAAS
jgi:hypothetical protein